jgi:hypothetical protein
MHKEMEYMICRFIGGILQESFRNVINNTMCNIYAKRRVPLFLWIIMYINNWIVKKLTWWKQILIII